jgi:hypothetical protein
MPVGGFELFILFFELFKETNILDGNDGLIGESLEQGNLTLREWLNFSAINNDRADQIIFVEHRHRENAPYALLAVFFRRVPFRIRCNIRNVDDLLLQPKAADCGCRVRRKYSICQYGHMRRNILSRN